MSMSMFRSKKFVAFLLGVIVLCLKSFLGVDDETALKIAALVGTYVFGQGIADGMSKGATSSLPGTPGTPE